MAIVCTPREFNPSEYDERGRALYTRICDLYAAVEKPADRMRALLSAEFTREFAGHFLYEYFLGSTTDNTRDALAYYANCLKLKPDYTDAYLNAANLHVDAGRKLEALALLDVAATHTNDSRIRNMYATFLHSMQQFEEAARVYDAILARDDISICERKMVLSNAGFTYGAMQEYDRGVAYYRRGIGLRHDCGECLKLDIQIQQNLLLSYDYMVDLPPNSFADYTRINKYLADAALSRRRIRIGYVSGDFRHHVVAFFIYNILKYQDRARFSVFCYSTADKSDDRTESFKRLPITWRDISGLDTKVAVNLIRGDRVDMLVDLSGHTTGHRLDIFAQGAARKQITYLGYPNTTGVRAMDYKITDNFADPPDTKQQYSEKLIRLPRCFLNYTAFVGFDDIEIVDRARGPGFVFCVVSKAHKINPMMIAIWSGILRMNPEARLLIRSDGFNISRFAADLVPRITCIPTIDGHINYLNFYNSVDLILDTYPYTGTTTTCCALIMGVPVLTLCGKDRHVSRVSASILANMGISECIAHTINEYAAIAGRFARELTISCAFRRHIRAKFLELMDPIKFAREFDDLVERIYFGE